MPLAAAYHFTAGRGIPQRTLTTEDTLIYITHSLTHSLTITHGVNL